MRFLVDVGGEELTVELGRVTGALEATIGERAVRGEAVWTSPSEVALTIDGVCHDVELLQVSADRLEVYVGGREVDVRFLDRGAGRGRAGGGVTAGGSVVSPMPGKVVAVLVAEGDEVAAGRGVVVVEAMKMENEIQVSSPGTVKRMRVEPGQVVEAGEVLLEIGEC